MSLQMFTANLQALGKRQLLFCGENKQQSLHCTDDASMRTLFYNISPSYFVCTYKKFLSPL